MSLFVNQKKVNLGVAVVVVVLALLLGGWHLWRQSGGSLSSLVSGGQRVLRTGAKYKIVDQKPSGWFKTGQEADIVLSAIDFNDAGGPLLFNHPGNLASDGKNLILADRNNNRVLIWNKAPDRNEPPDLVIGQSNFSANAPGNGMDQLNWPVCVATDGRRLIVCDTQNHRVLVWNEIPKQNGEPADLVFGGFGDEGIDQRGRIAWPWSAWSDGKKFVVTSTMGAQVLIWNDFPTTSQAGPDVVLRLPRFGTPRSIGSDGKSLAVSDHNAKNEKGEIVQGTFFWQEFPTRDNEPFDFFIAMPSGDLAPEGKSLAQGEVLWGMNFLPDGRFLGLGSGLYIWDMFPRSGNDVPHIKIGSTRPAEKGTSLQGGDGSGSVVVDGKLYLSLANGNKIVGFNGVPKGGSEKPDFAIGAPDVRTNTLQTEFIISNPVPATDGESLFVLSDFDSRLNVWSELPNESGAHPDFVYEGIEGDDIALFGDRLAVAGRKSVLIWNELPRSGEKSDVSLRAGGGGVAWQDLRGVAMDDKLFYLGDQNADSIYVWEGSVEGAKEPVAVLRVDRPLKISSDGKYLTAACCQNQPGGGVAIWRVDDIKEKGSRAQSHKLSFSGLHLNLPGAVLVYDSALFIADSGGNRVLIWKDVEKALRGLNPDVVLGQNNLVDNVRAIGRGSMFMPNALAFDGSFLWVGEVKFSERLLRFSASW